MMLAVATPHTGLIGETYIRQHIREIAPGHTVVVCFHDEEGLAQIMPVITLTQQRRSMLPWMIRKLVGLWSLVLWGYPGILYKDDHWKMVAFLKKYGVRTVLAEFGPMGCAIQRACVDAGAELFVHYHGHDATVLVRKLLYRYAYRRLGKRVSGIICHSKYLAEKLKAIGMPQRKIQVVPFGVDIRKFTPSQNRDPNLVLAVGRFVEKKAPHLTIRAFRRVIEKFPEARLEMIGDGPLLPRCQHLAEDIGLSTKVFFHGMKENNFVKKKMQEASVFVQHSITAPDGDTESLGISLLEAMASGVPVVATRHNGFVETVQEGHTGYLVDEFDIEAMAQRIIDLLDSPALQKDMGNAGRKRISEHFSPEEQIRRLRDIMALG